MRRESIIAIAPIVFIAVTIVLVVMAFAAIVVSLTSSFTMLPIMRNVDIVVPAVLHEINRASTRGVLATVLAPMLCMARRHVEIDGRRCDYAAHMLDEHRLSVHELWRGCASEGDLSVEKPSDMRRNPVPTETGLR